MLDNILDFMGDLLGLEDNAPDEAYPVDLDGDGIADAMAMDQFVDTDGDGIADTLMTEMAVDLDGDGIADSFQTMYSFDRDGDGNPDTFETIFGVDEDGDGIPDYEITSMGEDTDGDGIPDLFYTGEDTDGDGVADLFTIGQDTDGDGIVDLFHVAEDYDGDHSFDAFASYGDVDGDGDLESIDGYLDGSAAAYENYDPNEDDGGVIGDPAEDMQNWHVQETNSSCAVASQEFALEALTGREFSEAQLRDLAEQYGWYSPDGGTPLGDVGNILAHMGLNVEKSYGNTVFNIEQCLANGGEVIVGVDSSELWEGRSDDFYGPGMGADHAVQVIGIDHSTPMGPMVILNDSGCTNGCGAMIPLNDFMNAWEDSGCFMVEAYA